MKLVFLALGCTFFPDAADSPLASPDAVIGDCDPAVRIPVGLVADDPPAAQEHADRFGPNPTPRFVHLGVPSRDLSRSVAVLWQTDPETRASLLRIGPSATWPEGAVELEGGSYLYGGVELGTGTVRQHEVRICGHLEPSTSYTYQVGGGRAWSEPVSFATPGAPGTFDSFRVAIAGDSRGNPETWAAIVQAADAEEPDLFLLTGDMVNYGVSQSEWDDWFAAAGTVFARKHAILTHGNHEFLAQHYFAQFALPGNEEWFAVDYGDLLLLNMNDTVRSSDEIFTDQVSFATSELAASGARWKVAMHHQPEFAATRGHGSNVDLQEAWVPVWDRFGLDLVFTGHNHAYERSKPLRGGVEAEGGTIYVVTGGAGAPLYTRHDETFFTEVVTPIEHYVIADFSPEGVSVVAKDLSGNVIDAFSLPR